MEYFNWDLQQNFNTIYTNIENCILTNPPYLPWRVPETFFLDKRWGFSLLLNLWYDDIYDTVTTLWEDYYIWLIWTNIVVKKVVWWVISILSTTPKWTWNKKHKFLFWPSAKWTSLIWWTWLVSNIVDPLNMYLSDTTANWTVNAYAWMYCYVYWWTAWVWSITKIISNTANQLSIGSLVWTITWWTYKIFPDLSSILFFLWWDWLYWIHWTLPSDIIKAVNYNSSIDILFVQDRFFWIDVNWNINKWWKAESLLYQDATSNVATLEWVLAMTPFQDYLLVLWASNITVIRKEVITVWWNSIESFTSIEITKDFWIFSSTSYSIYNEWLYIFNSDKKFVSVSIRSITSSKFMIFIQDEWIYIQKDFDNIWQSTNVWIYIDSNEIKLINKKTNWTDIFIYDRYYKWWHTWRTELLLNWYYSVWKKYFGKDIYSINSVYTDDEWWLPITQKIKLIFWTNNFRTIKSVKNQKLTLWYDTSDSIIMNYRITMWEDLIILWKQLKWTKLLNQWKTASSNKWWMLWQSILWLWLIANSPKSLSSLYPQMWNINVKLWFSCELLEWELVAWQWEKISYWWQTIWFESLEPQITSVKNTI